MEKIFEDYLSEIQKDMLTIAWDYAGHKADKVFVYASCENDVVSSDCFFEINHKIWEKSKLKEIDSSVYDTSFMKQMTCLKALTKDIEKISALCKEYDKPMPTEIRLVYDAKRRKAGAQYHYEPVVAKSQNGVYVDVINDWIADERSKLQV